MANPRGCLENGCIRSQQDRAEKDDRDRYYPSAKQVCRTTEKGPTGGGSRVARAQRARHSCTGRSTCHHPRGRRYTRRCELTAFPDAASESGGKGILHTSADWSRRVRGATAVSSPPDPVVGRGARSHCACSRTRVARARPAQGRGRVTLTSFRPRSTRRRMSCSIPHRLRLRLPKAFAGPAGCHKPCRCPSSAPSLHP